MAIRIKFLNSFVVCALSNYSKLDNSVDFETYLMLLKVMSLLIQVALGLRKGKERNWEMCGKRRKDRYHACLDHFDTHH